MQSVAMPGNRKKRTSSRQNPAENWILLETNWRYLLLACVGSLCCHTCNFRWYKWVRCFGTGSCLDGGYNQHKNVLSPNWELLCFFAKSFLVKHCSSQLIFHPSTTTTSFFYFFELYICSATSVHFLGFIVSIALILAPPNTEVKPLNAEHGFMKYINQNVATE